MNGLAKQKASMQQIQPLACQFANHDLESSVIRLVLPICHYSCLYQFAKVISFVAPMIDRTLDVAWGDSGWAKEALRVPFRYLQPHLTSCPS